MMKKLICTVWVLAFFLSLAACTMGRSVNGGETPLPVQATPAPTTSPTPDVAAALTSLPSVAAPSETPNDFGYADLKGVEFCFASGVGAWSTIVEIMPDGSFTGYYHDSNAGERYECYFSGQFSPLTKTGDYEYAMKCISLQAEGIVGEEKMVDGVNVITADPYGFDDADEFFLYLPGKKESELTEDFISWARWGINDGVLTGYGLYNVGGGQGFIG